MTIDERFERLEHHAAGLDERMRREREEDRALWRDTQAQINRLGRMIADAEDQFLRYQTEQAERSRELDERFRKTDERIDKLISAIGEFIRREGKVAE
jgi:hypothetical protein